MTLPNRDRRLLTELVYGVLRNQGRLDFALTHFSKTPLEKLENQVLLLLRLGSYQILELDRIPDSAAVNETVNLAKRGGLQRAAGLINGILRNLVRQKNNLPWPERSNPKAYLQHCLSLPAWLADRCYSQWADGAMELAEALLKPAPFTLRVNTLKLSREEFLKELELAGHEAEATGFAPEGVVLKQLGDQPLPGDKQGWYQVQDEASMLIAHLLSPRPEERILDACAAPGGKTTHLAALTGDRARITALDLHPQRIVLIDQGAARLGIHGIQAQPCDLTRPLDFLSSGGFDRVLVDAPCSGLGVIRRNPEARWRIKPQDIAELANRQLTILTNCALQVRPGGCLVYSLCTFTPEETDGVLTRFLQQQPEFALEPLSQTVPAAWEVLLDNQGCLRSYPHRHAGMDAFFAARLIRKLT